jgi:hypothetical protein
MNLDDAISHIISVGTNGCNYDIMTDDIINQLKAWSGLCQFEITEIGEDRLELQFITLPDDLKAFCQHIYQFCPDTIDQGYGLFTEISEDRASLGMDLPNNIDELMGDGDSSQIRYGLELMQQDLAQNKTLVLWWD